MAEESMMSVPGLLSLPVDVLLVIGEYLCPQDLLSLSAVCRYLRSVINVNSFWLRYTGGGRLSRGLDSTVSLVEPKFENPCTTGLEPLCERRFHFLKESRLLNNLRQGKFIEHSTAKPSSRSSGRFKPAFETPKPLNNRQVIYRRKFLFTVDHGDDTEVINIFDVEILPTFLKTVKLKNHSAGNCIITCVQVIGDKLVVQRDKWFDIYEIKLPESLDILYSIDVDKLKTQRINKALIINRLLFVENCTLNVLHIWDLSNGSQCNDLNPKISGPSFNILGYSENEQFVLLSVGMYIEEPSDPHIFVYDIESQDFTTFNPVLEKNAFKCKKCYGLIDKDYVVFLSERNNLKFSVIVLDYNKSTLVAKKSNLTIRRIEDAKLIAGYLVLPSLVSVLVKDLKSLQILWEIQLDTARSHGYEFPRVYRKLRVEAMHIFSLASVIVIHKDSGVEIWDLHNRRKFLDIQKRGNVVMNDTCSKLIFCDSQNLAVLSFW